MLAYHFIEQETLAQVFSYNLAKFLRTPFLTEHFRWLLLPGWNFDLLNRNEISSCMKQYENKITIKGKNFTTVNRAEVSPRFEKIGLKRLSYVNELKTIFSQ